MYPLVSRYDILHACDVAEDFAVAYGFDRLREDMHLPSTNTIGQEFELNYLSDKMRLLLSQNNYIEVATFSLCSKVMYVSGITYVVLSLFSLCNLLLSCFLFSCLLSCHLALAGKAKFVKIG